MHPGRAPLMNLDRAHEVMAKTGIAALLLTEPLNIYHATGFWPLTLEMGHAGSTMALVSADPARPPALLTGQFLHYFLDVGEAIDVAHDYILYTAPSAQDAAIASDPFFFASGGGPEDVFERMSRSASANELARRPAEASPAAALAAALRVFDCENGVLATDSQLASAVLASIGIERMMIPAEPLLRQIRIIKSDAEIALMRVAAVNNADAAAAAVASVRVGDRYTDLRHAFFAETGQRGGRPAFMHIDSTAAEQRDGKIRAGRAFQIDAVASYSRYHGDFGRTVFVGDPDPAALRAVEAASSAAAAVRAELRPGLHYSDVTRIGREAVARAGIDLLVAATPHSVGLYHTDEPAKDDAMLFAKDDLLIRERMVLSVDFPVLATDIGGTVHLEDLWLITSDGCEPLNALSSPFFTL